MKSFTLKEFHISFYSTPKEIVTFYNLPLKTSMVTQPWVGEGGTDIKCNSLLKYYLCRTIHSDFKSLHGGFVAKKTHRRSQHSRRQISKATSAQRALTTIPNIKEGSTCQQRNLWGFKFITFVNFIKCISCKST